MKIGSISWTKKGIFFLSALFLVLSFALSLSKSSGKTGLGVGLAYAEEEEKKAEGEEKIPQEHVWFEEGKLKYGLGPEDKKVITQDRYSFPVIGNRKATWMLAQLHILFASFILGCPMFIIIMEIMGVKTKDDKYERLAHEVTKVIGMCYSFTALSGGFFLFVLIVAYPEFMTFLLKGFPVLSTVVYPIVFVLETILMYAYVYTWDPLNTPDKKWKHILIGIMLNIAGVSLLLIMDSPASFMLTPTKPLKDLGTMTELQWFLNFSWMPINYHRLVGNITYGGYMVGLISAYMYLWADKEEDREYYDWQGYIGNAIGLGAMLAIPAMGYIYIREVYEYDAAIGMYIMSDRLSMFMLIQALLIVSMFLGSNYYMYVSMKRVSGAEKYFKYMKAGFVMLFVCGAIWFAPKRFYATMMPEEGMPKEAELPGALSFFAVMVSKNSAAVLVILITLINYIMYVKSTKSGKIEWGSKANPILQYLLIFLAFSNIWLMSWMGTIRELARKNFHIYKVFKEYSNEKHTLTLAEAGKFTTTIVWIFFILLTFVIWLSLKYPKTAKAKQANHH